MVSDYSLNSTQPITALSTRTLLHLLRRSRETNRL